MEKKMRAVGDPLGLIGHEIVKSHEKWDSVLIGGSPGRCPARSREKGEEGANVRAQRQ